MTDKVLKNQMEKILREQAAGDVQKTLYVLKGVPVETVDPENAGQVDLEKLLENRFGYFGEMVNRRRFVTYEEFLLLDRFILMQYDRVCILNNNLWMTEYPVDLRCSEDQLQGLIANFREDADDNQVVGPIEDLIELFDAVRADGKGCVVAYRKDRQLQDGKIEEMDLFPATDRKIPVKDAVDACVDLLEEGDYVSLVQSLSAGPREVVVRTENYNGDRIELNGRLRILAEYFGDAVKLYLQQTKTVTPAFEHRPEYTDILHQYWNQNSSFREIPVYDMAKLQEKQKEVVHISQEQIISDLVTQVENCAEKGRDHRDVFVTASTGSGKSAMFQIPAIYLAEKYNLMTIVISPLISLMNDQIIGLEKRGYTKAKTLNSDISPIVKEEIRQKVADGEYHILYMSPETLLARSDVEQLIGDRTIGMIVVDEAHIVTTWGKQFRPDYWYLGDHIKKLRRKQKEEKGRSFVVSTFTATAIYGGAEDMYDETVNSLQMLNPITYLGYVKRDDIDIVIEKEQKESGRPSEYNPDKFADIEDLIRRAVIMNRKTLIYFPMVTLIRECYDQLRFDQLTAPVCCYYGPMDRDEKAENYEKFRKGDKLVMLATKAFGMGVDIPDIAIVAHFAPTGNVCDYVQEIGRAARDPELQGEAYYKYYTRDFKHINRLHGMNRIHEYQLIEVMRKIVDLYWSNQKSGRKDLTRKSRSMLLDAESFAYIFPSPRGEQDESINKVKTALLMIQKDFLLKFRNHSPISVRPIPVFETGYFQVSPAVQKRLLEAYPDCLKEIDPSRHICSIRLGYIWKTDPACSKYSFPKFKFLLYTRSTDLELNRVYTLTPALTVSIDLNQGADSNYGKILASLKTFIHNRIIDGKQAHVGDLSQALADDCSLSGSKARTICEVALAAMETWQRRYAKGSNAAVSTYYDNAGTPRYAFNVAVNSFFAWLDKIWGVIRKEIKDGKLYLVNDGSVLIQETATVLGILEAFGVLSFEMLGGANSQIYIYVNQIKSLENVVSRPGAYRNRLLDMVSERHTMSVKMLTYLYEHDFTSGERWDLLEDYFLGKIPEEVEKAAEKDKAKTN